MSDAELLENIKAAYRSLLAALNDALDAGLKVDCRINADETYYPGGAPHGRVRGHLVKVTRVLE